MKHTASLTQGNILQVLLRFSIPFLPVSYTHLCCCSERYFHHVCLCGIYQKKRVRVLLTACKERKKMCAATVGAGMHIGR